MRVIEEATTVVECENCGSKIEVALSDTQAGWLGARYFICPICEAENMAEDFPDTILTAETIKFPQHFAHTYVGAGKICVRIEPERVAKAVEELKERIAHNGWNVLFTSFGDMFIIVRRVGDTYTVYETHDFYEGEIPMSLDWEGEMEDGILTASSADTVEGLIKESVAYFTANPSQWSWQLDSDERLFFATNMIGDEVINFYVADKVKVYEA